MLPAGSATRPRAQGQMPASARNSVLLPLPEGPCSTVCWPGAMASVAPCTRTAPVGRATLRSSAARVLAPAPRTVSSGLGEPCWRDSAASKLVRRSVVARQAARPS